MLTSLSINLPVVSGIKEVNGVQEIFTGPSLMMAAIQLKASMRSDISLGLPEPAADVPFWHLKVHL